MTYFIFVLVRSVLYNAATLPFMVVIIKQRGLTNEKSFVIGNLLVQELSRDCGFTNRLMKQYTEVTCLYLVDRVVFRMKAAWAKSQPVCNNLTNIVRSLVKIFFKFVLLMLIILIYLLVISFIYACMLE